MNVDLTDRDQLLHKLSLVSLMYNQSPLKVSYHIYHQMTEKSKYSVTLFIMFLNITSMLIKGEPGHYLSITQIMIVTG